MKNFFNTIKAACTDAYILHQAYSVLSLIVWELIFIRLCFKVAIPVSIIFGLIGVEIITLILQYRASKDNK